MTLRPFHLAIPVHDLALARAFYINVLQCPMGRRSEAWIDFDLFGHQVVVHLDKGGQAAKAHTPVDGDQVPVPHFGVVLGLDQWKELRDRLLACADIQWVIRPRIRFEGQAGEQATLFLLDPSGNALEFKAFADLGQLFATTL